MKNGAAKTSPALNIMALFLLASFVVLTIDSVIDIAKPARKSTSPNIITIAGRATPDPALSVPGSVLTAHEIAHMRYMREEEKLAHDVYQSFSGTWGVPVFGKIARAEQRHTEVVLGLLVFYGIPDPAANLGPGQFADPRLASLYSTLIEKGATSLTDALMVGGLVEEVDIADLENAVASTNRPDIIRVYENIHRGSRNHLRSFAGNLARSGIAYHPQKLGAAEVQSILSSPMENGPPRY
jgi:hypothetical protein